MTIAIGKKWTSGHPWLQTAHQLPRLPEKFVALYCWDQLGGPTNSNCIGLTWGCDEITEVYIVNLSPSSSSKMYYLNNCLINHLTPPYTPTLFSRATISSKPTNNLFSTECQLLPHLVIENTIHCLAVLCVIEYVYGLQDKAQKFWMKANLFLALVILCCGVSGDYR